MSSDDVRIASRDRTWLAVQRLGRRMLQAGRAGDWTNAHQILAERSTLIRRFFLEPIPPEEAPKIAALIREALEEHDQLLRISEASREALQERLRHLKLGQMARRAYLSEPQPPSRAKP